MLLSFPHFPLLTSQGFSLFYGRHPPVKAPILAKKHIIYICPCSFANKYSSFISKRGFTIFILKFYSFWVESNPRGKDEGILFNPKTLLNKKHYWMYLCLQDNIALSIINPNAHNHSRYLIKGGFRGLYPYIAALTSHSCKPNCLSVVDSQPPYTNRLSPFF